MRKEIIAFRDPKSPISEVFRTLRTNIQFMNINKNLKTLLVTSTLPKEGKSWVSSNLAVTFAQAEKKVILIDADMRKGRQYSIFGVYPRPGLANYLSECKEDAGIEDISRYIQETEVQDLHIIAAGNVPPNPSELLITPQMSNLLEKLSVYYDTIIIDAPPCELVTDATIISRMVDSTVIVTSYKQTKKANLQKTIKSIKNVGGNIAGIVLNKIPVDAKKYQKSYYYGSQIAPSTKTKGRNTFLINEVENVDKTKKEIEQRTEARPKLKKNEKMSNSDDTANCENTEKILKQVNEYLEKEKQNLKNSKRGK